MGDTSAYGLGGGSNTASPVAASGPPAAYWNMVAGGGVTSDAPTPTDEAYLRATSGSGGRLVLSAPDGSSDEAIQSEAVRRTNDYLKTADPNADSQSVYESFLQEVEAERSANVVTQPYKDIGDGIIAIPLPAPDSTGSTANGSLRPIGPVQGFFTFNPLGRTLNGAAQGVVNMLTAIPTVAVEGARIVGDLGGYYNAAGLPSQPGYQPSSVLFKTLEQDGPLPLVGGVVNSLTSPLKNIYNGVMFNRYEALGEGLA